MKEQSQALGGARKAKALSAVAVVAVLLATLWPFSPHPRNGVNWLQGTNGLKFEKAGLVVSSEPLRISDRAQSVSLELLLRPVTVKSSHTILAFCTASCSRHFQVQQWKHALLITHDPRATYKVGTVNLFVGHVFLPGKPVFVAVTASPDGTKAYIDGQLAQWFPKFEISGNDLSGEFYIGTSPVSYHPWSGQLKGLAVYAKELAAQDVLNHYRRWTSDSAHHPSDFDTAIAFYDFTEGTGAEVHNQVASGPNLVIPPSFSVPHKPMLESPVEEFKPTGSYAYDLATNIAGFVPLGLIVCSYLSWTRSRGLAMLMTVVFCGSLSLGIEVMQYYIPRRGSGLTDVITNTLGAALGALLMQSNLVRRLLATIGLVPPAQ